MAEITPELSIIMPCLNEELTVGHCIEQARDWLRTNDVSGEVVIGDNGSTDNSVTIAMQLGARVIHVSERGYGAACYNAALAARGKYIIMGDADGSYNFSDLWPFLNNLRAGYDLVMGNRFRGGIEPGAMPWKNKYLGNPVMSFIGKALFGCPVNDFHCGLRGFSSEAFRRLDLQTTGMEYASEMVIKATLLDLKITEVPTTLKKDGRDRPPHLKPWRDGWRHLRFMLLFSPRWLFWYPGWLSILIGTIALTVLYFGPVRIGGVSFDIHTMLYASLLIIAGYQSITFGVLTRTLGCQFGLLPANDYINTFNKYFKLEYVLVFGFILLLLGIIGFAWSILTWQKTGFGALDPVQTMRIIIPASLLFIVGIQSILSAFALSFIYLGVRRDTGK